MENTLTWQVDPAPAEHHVKPPRKTGAAVDAENRLAACSWPRTFDFLGETLYCQPAKDAPADLNSFNRLALRINDHAAELFLDKPFFEQLTGRIDPEVLEANLDGKVAALLIEAGLAPQLEEVERSLGWQITLEHLHPSQDRLQENVFWISLELGDEVAGQLGLALHPDHLGALARKLEEGGERNAPSSEDLPVTLALRIGSTTLGAGDLKTLRPSDIVLLDNTKLASDGLGVIGGEQWLFDASLTDKGVTLSSMRRAPHSRDRDLWLMDTFEPADDRTSDAVDAEDGGQDQSDGETLKDLDELPVKLLFEIGRVDVSLGDLGKLGPGHVFDLDRALQRSVDIYAAGKHIGVGDIVEIEGRIGVRFARLFGHG